MRQRTLAMMSGFERYTKKMRRGLFLEEMELVVPWQELCALIEPHYPKAGNGRPPVGVERMLRIYFLQQWFNLSDPAVEEALYDSVVMRQFVGIDLGHEPVPDETTVCKFRHLLEEHSLGGQMLAAVNLHLQSKGVRLPIVNPPASAKDAYPISGPTFLYWFRRTVRISRSARRQCGLLNMSSLTASPWRTSCTTLSCLSRWCN